MKIELTEADIDGDMRQSIHKVHQELWVRVLSPEPLGPEAWKDCNLVSRLPAWAVEKYLPDPCGFDCDLWDEDDADHEEHGFEQYWFLPIRGGKA